MQNYHGTTNLDLEQMSQNKKNPQQQKTHPPNQQTPIQTHNPLHFNPQHPKTQQALFTNDHLELVHIDYFNQTSFTDNSSISNRKNIEQQRSSVQQQSPSDEEVQKSDNNIDQNKSEGDQEQQQEQDSNIKSDDREEDERSGQDTKKEEPSGKKCFNKLCASKKIYKKLRSKVEHAKYRFLCRPCYQNYCNNDFCQFCEQIYSSTGNAEDDDQWIGCDECNRWNHIECQKKYRNKNIHEIKDQDTAPYLCLTCSYKAKQKSSAQNKQRGAKKDYTVSNEDPRILKQRPQISKQQRVAIFNRKIQSLPSLQYFLQNYNFRLWINENLIKDDLETLREASKRSSEEGKKGTKKVKTD